MPRMVQCAKLNKEAEGLDRQPYPNELGKRIFAAIRAEWELAHETLALITGETQRLQSNPTLARSIAHRFPYLDPLNHLQVELLRRYRQRREDDPVVERLKRGIHLSINGIAAGLRNTG